MIYKFVSHDIDKLETLKDTKIYKLHEKLLTRGEIPTRKEKNYLFDIMHNNCKYGVKLHGWLFDFSSILKEYWVQFNYGHIEVFYALDKTSIRQNPYMMQIKSIVKVTK